MFSSIIFLKLRLSLSTYLHRPLTASLTRTSLDTFNSCLLSRNHECCSFLYYPYIYIYVQRKCLSCSVCSTNIMSECLFYLFVSVKEAERRIYVPRTEWYFDLHIMTFWVVAVDSADRRCGNAGGCVTDICAPLAVREATGSRPTGGVGRQPRVISLVNQNLSPV